MSRDFSRLQLGTAPDSWGVWFPQDPQQVDWKQYLDDVANAGYVWTELGPQGFLPQDPQQLRDELDQRGLKACGGTVFAGLHKGKEALEKAIAEFSQEAKLLTEVGAKYLIHLPEQYTDMHTGEALESTDIDPEQWSNLISGTNELGRVLYEEFGVELVFHPHADTHVDTQDRILGETGTVELAESSRIIVKRKGEYSGRVPTDWRERFIRAYDTEFQEWINAVAAGTSTGPSSWDGYAATVVTDAGSEAARTGQRVTVSMREQPDLYRVATGSGTGTD